MYSGRLLILLVVFALLFTACQSNAESQENPDNPPASAEQGKKSASEEDAEPQSDEAAYPAPEQEQLPPLPAVLYPMAANGDEVSWIQAQGMIGNGEVDRIVQTHELEVTLYLKDGRALVTIEPAIDEVLKVIEMCGESCSGIAVATE